MQKTVRHLPFIAGFAMIIGPVGADETTLLDPITVSATRSEGSSIPIPAGITVINRREIESSGASNLADLLKARSGIQIQDIFGDGSNAVIDMRGFGPTAGSNTLVLVDGRRLNNSSDIAAPDLHSVNLEDVERVEIIQGSAGILFGNQAVGGVVNIITRRPREFRASVRVGLGSYDGSHYSARLEDRLDNGLAYRLTARKEDSDNYRDNNDVSLEDLALRLDYSYSKGNVFLEHERIDDDQEQPGSLFKDELKADRRQSAAVYAGNFSDTDSTLTRVGFRHYLTGHWELQAEYSDRDNDGESVFSLRCCPNIRITKDRRVKEFTPRLVGSVLTDGGELLLTLGIDWESTDYKLVSAFGPQLLDQKIWAAYGQAVIPFGERWSATIGARYAEVENDITSGASVDLDDSVNLGSAGLVFRPNEEWRLFARLDQNYRFAKVDEHTNPVFGQPFGLKNQTGLSVETGAELRRRDLYAKLVVYQLRLEDEISFDSSGFFNINLENTRRRGLIVEGEWMPSRDWRFGGSYTYVDADITGGPFKGNKIPLVAEHNARFYTNLAISPLLSLYTEAIFVSDQILSGDFANAFSSAAGYGVINALLSFQKEEIRFTARINNLLDKKYVDSGALGFMLPPAYYPAPERNFWITAAYRFGN